MRQLWIVGLLMNGETQEGWEFCGVFSSEARAIEACRNERHFVGPATLDEHPPEYPVPWPGAFRPLDKVAG